jgi:restriction system protein
MARTKKTSPAEDLLDLVAMLPWWAGIGLALSSYFVLHSLATPDTTTALQPGHMGDFVARAMWKAIAHAAQFFVPPICLAGAALSAWRRRQRKALTVDVAQSTAANALDGMTWREFEMLVGEAFRLRGYRVVETGGNGPDGGIDLVLSKGNEKFFVQCKQWKAFKVGVDVVRELYGVMAAKGAAGGFVVTSGRFTSDATAFASGRNLKLIDGPMLLGLIKQANVAIASSQGNMAMKGDSYMSSAKSDLAPSCPTCSKTMVRRSAKRGANAGLEFWGCAAYPACKGIRPIG